jgi:hypothetical protein
MNGLGSLFETMGVKAERLVLGLCKYINHASIQK